MPRSTAVQTFVGQRFVCPLRLLLPLLSLLFLLPLTTATNELSYQAHSYNDLRQWPSLILKGAQWLKVDMNFAPSAFCTANATATRRVHDGSAGCFLLNHDDVALNRTAPYNTSDDVLSLVEGWAGRGWLRGAANVSIALCFKYDYGGVCDNSTESGQWRALMDAFYERAQSLISAHNLSLVFVLDGAGSIDPRSPCLTPLYPGWPSTFIPYDNTMYAFNSSATETLLRSNLLNVRQDTFANVSAQHYGKFQPSPYPWLVWEPSDQRTIRNISRTYLANGAERHKPGLRFAINIDPGSTAAHEQHSLASEGAPALSPACCVMLCMCVCSAVGGVREQGEGSRRRMEREARRAGRADGRRRTGSAGVRQQLLPRRPLLGRR